MPAQRKTNQSKRLTGAGLIAVTAATLLMMAWAIFPTAALADQQISVNQGSLTNHECNADEWHFLINQIDVVANAPATIHVTWANGNSADLTLDKFTGGVAHYLSTANLDSTVTSATATIYDGWNGMFNLSHGPCGTTTPGSITVVKQTDPDGSSQQFTFDTSYDAQNFTLTDGQQNDSGDLDPGTYSVAEVNIPAGWTLTSAICSDQSDPSSINLAAGEHVTCTFTNTQTPPGGGGGGGGATTPPPAPTTPPAIAPTTVHNTSSATTTDEVLPTTVKPSGTAFTGPEDVVPIGTLALILMTSGSGLLWAGARRRRHDGSVDED